MSCGLFRFIISETKVAFLPLKPHPLLYSLSHLASPNVSGPSQKPGSYTWSFSFVTKPCKFIILNIFWIFVSFSNLIISCLYCQNSLLTARWGSTAASCLSILHEIVLETLWTAWSGSKSPSWTHKCKFSMDYKVLPNLDSCHLDFSSLSSHRDPEFWSVRSSPLTRHCVSFMTHLWPCLAKKIQKF